ncbi:MAG: prepilin-type N-terminal cleavage/methylation domain-containing protein [Pirellulaceae bacterium]|jgi:prepilin-type N-terminal cleavage/methylation domain-containing protein
MSNIDPKWGFENRSRARLFDGLMRPQKNTRLPNIGSRPTKLAICRSAFTLIELLVVIAIIGILSALLLPAVQAARESARRIECTNHLKQMGIALHSHHNVYRRFPIGRWRQWDSDLELREFRGTTLTYLLPYMEQQELYDSYDFEENIITYQVLRGTNDRIGLQKIPAFTCPSDHYGRKSSHNSSGVNNYASSAGGRWLNSPSRSSCACVHGLTRTYFDPLRGSGILPNVTTTGPFNDRYHFRDGIRREIPETRVADVLDGTSNTIFMGEILVGSRIWVDRGGAVSRTTAVG